MENPLDTDIAELMALRDDVANALRGHTVNDCLTVMADHVAATLAYNTSSPEAFQAAVELFTSTVVFRGLDFIEGRLARKKAH